MELLIVCHALQEINAMEVVQACLALQANILKKEKAYAMIALLEKCAHIHIYH
jgi:hypothetical protein